MKVETRTFTVYTVTYAEHEWLDEAGLWDLLLNRLNTNERIEVEQG